MAIKIKSDFYSESNQSKLEELGLPVPGKDHTV